MLQQRYTNALLSFQVTRKKCFNQRFSKNALDATLQNSKQEEKDMGITVEHLTAERKDFTLRDITFSLPDGYILGIVGRNGSGKTTLLQTLLSGEKEKLGEEERKEYHKRFAFISEECMLPENLSAKDVGEMFGPLYDSFDAEKYEGLLTDFRIPIKRRIAVLSKGMKIKLQIAFAFSYRSKTLILDEPSANLDSFARKDLYRLLFEYMEQEGRTVLWATHLTDELDRMADYLLLLEQGEQKFFGEKDKILSQYTVVKGSRKQLDCMKSFLLGRIDRETYSEGLAKTADGPFRLADRTEPPNIEQLMCYLFGKNR